VGPPIGADLTDLTRVHVFETILVLLFGWPRSGRAAARLVGSERRGRTIGALKRRSLPPALTGFITPVILPAVVDWKERVSMAGRLTGKAAIVLGAAGRNNMGQAIARRFRDEGAQVTVAGRQGEELKRFAGEIDGHWATCDITSLPSVAALAAHAKAAMGHVDIGVNATGWGYLAPFLESTEADIDRIMDLQFKGPFFFFQEMIKAMEQGGSIIQISSATATIMLDNHAAYMGTKAGTDHVVRCVANEFGERGIRANSISPGLTETPMTGGDLKSRPGVLEAFTPCYPLGRIGTSDDIAAAAVWLASDECFMTGQNLQVNGGLTLRRNPRGEEIYRSVQTAMAARAAG
jgi:NAD(P)-dependent dehydrogenase (short-subunit alcohol dehydrogenase family)